ncbi:MAG: glutamate synthase large subunit [Deltaproteobacteria bacterium]|nr:glutamate synthase large subunit [Deltaproteobacteria bacterium]
MQRPDRFGLYEPAMEHDACGVGFVAHIKGEKSRSIVEQGLEVLRRLSHRAACGCDPETGDGAGILLQLPHRFFKRVGVELGFDIPPRRSYGVGQVFLPSDDRARAACERAIEEVVAAEGQRIVGWRDVPTDPRHVGRIAAQVVPVFRQVYIARRRLPPSAFERKLYIIRKLIGSRVRGEGLDPQGLFHIASLSSETIVYKGFLLPAQLPLFFPDLQDDAMVSAIALVHSRFSTNTFPAWDLAQPFRFIAHNGEINTLSGNRNWMLARRSLLQSAKFGGPLERFFPIIVPGKSDSAQFDNMLELLHLGGRSLPHSMMMMIPEAWESHDEMSPELRAFYRYAASLLEPWDGPAAIVFTDGQVVGGTLDRNGLRPARYLITEDDRVVLASETGVIDVPPEQVRAKGRLQPGKMFLVDTEEGRIIDDQEVKRDIAGRFPFGRWLEKNLLDVDQFPEVPAPDLFDEEALHRQQRAFGYSEEDVRILIAPMAERGEEPVGAMGSDTPLAVLSQFSPNLSNYFHQLFAQVTNPPIDPIRESLVMSLTTTIGPTGNTFDETPEQCHRLKINSPILSSAELAKVASIREGVFEPAKLSMLYYLSEGPEGLERAVDRLCAQAMSAIDDGHNILVLSDRGVDAKRVAVPALLAVAAVHQHLVREGIRMQAGLVVETGAAREVHDFALLIGYGAAAVNPYVALETVRRLCEDGTVDKTPDEAEKNYVHAIEKGILKILSKMGISTLASYRGAHLFEALGLDRALVDKCFTDTPSRIQGVGMIELGTEVLERHRGAFDPQAADTPLPIGGQYQWRRRGEAHMWNPATIAKLQAAAAANDPKLFKEYCDLIDGEDRALINLRSLLDFDEEGVTPVPLEEVEPATSIVRRFVTGAMSFGSISAEAHETLAIAMNRIGARSNSGEGGEEEHRFQPDDNGDFRRSAIKQVASARFGVTTHYLVNADDLQIKVAQGAKPGEGGQLPGHKVDERIAKVRHSTPGVTLISPPPHHDIYSIEDLAQLIYDLQTVNTKARVSVKLVSSAGVGTIAAGVAKARAGAVVIAGWDGGTGASPVSSIKHAGVPWELGLAETQQVLIQNDLRRRIRVQVDGGLRTGRDVVIAALLGAEEFGIATAALIVEGCVMMRKCHLNTCSVGIATQDPALRKRFRGNPDHVVNFFFLLVEDVRRRMASLGFRTVDEMVGRVERLKMNRHQEHWKASRIDLSEMLVRPRPFGDPTLRMLKPEPWDLSDHLDHRLIREAKGPIEGTGRIEINLPVNNTHRAVGAMLSGEIAKRHGARGLADDAIHVNLTGSAGQSFGAFLARGVTLELAGDANDYLGKGLSGGRVIVYPPSGSRFVPEDNIIIGNTVLYGATSGEVFISGLAGERFAVRNSGANAVVEGVGDHGCEYMTGGRVVVLGTIGRNFAAGMSGGIAYIFDRENLVKKRVNLGMVELESLYDESEIWFIYNMIEEHVRYTGSPLGARLLDNWEHVVPRFVKIMPNDYKRALQAQTVSKARMPGGGRQRLALVQGGAV